MALSCRVLCLDLRKRQDKVPDFVPLTGENKHTDMTLFFSLYNDNAYYISGFIFEGTRHICCIAFGMKLCLHTDKPFEHLMYTGCSFAFIVNASHTVSLIECLCVFL
jgi:hypothetical protein